MDFIVSHHWLYSKAFLIEVAQKVFMYARSQPVTAEMLKRGQPVLYSDIEGLQVYVACHTSADEDRVLIQELDANPIEVTLPQVFHWSGRYDLHPTPAWLKVAMDATPNCFDLSRLSEEFSSTFRLNQIAVLFGYEVPALVEKVLLAIADQSTLSNRLLAASVLMSDGDSEMWDVDIRGFSLSQWLAKSLPPANAGEPAVDSDPAIEVPAE